MIDPTTEVRAAKVGLLPGVVLVVWAGAFSFFRDEFSPVVFWALLLSVSVLIVAVPSWLFGRLARRKFLENQDS